MRVRSQNAAGVSKEKVETELPVLAKAPRSRYRGLIWGTKGSRGDICIMVVCL